VPFAAAQSWRARQQHDAISQGCSIGEEFRADEFIDCVMAANIFGNRQEMTGGVEQTCSV
jgi:hypothetical protein